MVQTPRLRRIAGSVSVCLSAGRCLSLPRALCLSLSLCVPLCAYMPVVVSFCPALSLRVRQPIPLSVSLATRRVGAPWRCASPRACHAVFPCVSVFDSLFLAPCGSPSVGLVSRVGAPSRCAAARACRAARARRRPRAPPCRPGVGSKAGRC